MQQPQTISGIFVSTNSLSFQGTAAVWFLCLLLVFFVILCWIAKRSPWNYIFIVTKALKIYPIP